MLTNPRICKCHPPETLIKDVELLSSHVFDLHDAIPYWSMPEEERRRIWTDGLHFTDEGYDRMGTLVGGELHRLMSSSESKIGQGQGQKPLMLQKK